MRVYPAAHKQVASRRREEKREEPPLLEHQSISAGRLNLSSMHMFPFHATVIISRESDFMGELKDGICSAIKE